jgi:hypothetical protein
MGSWLPAGKPYTLSINSGFRLDNSAKSAGDPMLLSLADRSALGVSNFDAVLLGTGGTYDIGRVQALAEWSWDVLVGRGAPPARESPMRVTAGARFKITDALMLQANVDVNLAKSPVVDINSPLIPIEPRFRALIGVHFNFGHPDKPRSLTESLAADKATEKVPEPPPPARLVGTVEWGGVGVARATVRVSVAGSSEAFTATCDADGKFDIDGLPSGAAKVAASASGYKSHEVKTALTSGDTASVTVPLEKELPPGQLRGVVRSLRGTPIAGATLRVQPGGTTAVTDASGYFELVLAPGDYEVEMTAAGHESQRPTVHIDQNGVTIYNFDLKPKK